MSVGREYDSTMPPKLEVFILEQVAFGISIVSDNSGILFLVVRTSESLLDFFGVSLVCDKYLLNRTKSHLLTIPWKGFMALAYPEEREKGVWRAIQWTW
jgi:hypothetical protein